MGTPEFMAPELLTAGTHTTASDVYAFGLLLYEFCRCAQTMKRKLGLFLMISAHLKSVENPDLDLIFCGERIQKPKGPI